MNSFLKLEKGAILAPMADVTNVGFRTLAREYGAALAYTELISVKGLLHKNRKTKAMLAVSESEKPVFLQLFGNNASEFGTAISIIEKEFPNNFAGYDINCGCSVPKAVSGQYGSSLMDNPVLIGDIVHEMKKNCEKPVTLKVRLGLKEEKFLEVAKEAENAGASAIALHARFGSQGYSGTADWKKIELLKSKVKIPVIGNGDVRSVEDYLRVKKESGVDFVMIGRGAIGNAFLFKQIKQFENKEKVSERTRRDILVEGTRYFELAREFNLGVNNLRGYFLAVANGLNGAKELRNKFALSKTIEDLEIAFNDFFKEN